MMEALGTREHGLHLAGRQRGRGNKKRLVFPRAGSTPAWTEGWSPRPPAHSVSACKLLRAGLCSLKCVCSISNPQYCRM